jgi:uncharacterized protein (DUF58 family)
MSLPFDLELERLDRLLIKNKGGLAGSSSGKRLTNRYGSSLEFADFRPYLPGDDIRRVDWSLYGRSGRLYTRLNRSEMDATVNVVVDGSASMDWGEFQKGRRSLGLALALSYISIRAYDRVSLGVGRKDLGGFLPPVHGRAAMPRIVHFLEQQQFGHEGDLNRLLFSMRRVLRPKQFTVVISDFLSPGGWRQGLENLLTGRQQILVFVVVSPDELEPDWRGALTLVDSETGAKQDVDLDHWTMAGYRQAGTEHREEIMDFCRSRGIGCHVYDVSRNPVDYLASIAGTILKPI